MRKSKPPWLKKHLPKGGMVTHVERLVKGHRLNTVCHGAKCPNRNDCFSEGTATFLILGDTCTRHCRFCSIPKKPPLPPDHEEPERLARAVKDLGISYAVVTSVTRDDLEDGGASHFAAVIQAIRSEAPGVRIEVLVPDFQGARDALNRVLDAEPHVLNHNIETVPSLYAKVRPAAEYRRSLDLLDAVAAGPSGIPAKSGLMVGLGETAAEVIATLEDLRSAGVELITIGQYLQPGPECLEVAEFVTPEQFDRYAKEARRLGFSGVASAPFVRSSHRAGELYRNYLDSKRRKR
ncbi:MAG: lipoyl synthase [Planctomycetota bacterium]|jgi:lipoic acid synthetase